MGYSAIYALCEILNMPLGEFIEAIASGKDPKLNPSPNWGGALRITRPPYPMVEDTPETEGIPIRGIEDFEHIFPLDVMFRDGKLQCSGYDSILCEVTGNNETVEGLWEDIYKIAGRTLNEGLLIPNKQMRLDCLENAQKRIQELDELGFLELQND